MSTPTPSPPPLPAPALTQAYLAAAVAAIVALCLSPEVHHRRDGAADHGYRVDRDTARDRWYPCDRAGECAFGACRCSERARGGRPRARCDACGVRIARVRVADRGERGSGSQGSSGDPRGGPATGQVARGACEGLAVADRAVRECCGDVARGPIATPTSMGVVPQCRKSARGRRPRRVSQSITWRPTAGERRALPPPRLIRPDVSAWQPPWSAADRQLSEQYQGPSIERWAGPSVVNGRTPPNM